MQERGLRSERPGPRGTRVPAALTEDLLWSRPFGIFARPSSAGWGEPLGRASGPTDSHLPGPAPPGAVRSTSCLGSCQGVTNGLSVAIRAAGFHLPAAPLRAALQPAAPRPPRPSFCWASGPSCPGPRAGAGEPLPAVLWAWHCIQLLRALGLHPASIRPSVRPAVRAACSPARSPAGPSPSEPRPGPLGRLRLPRCAGAFRGPRTKDNGRINKSALRL